MTPAFLIAAVMSIVTLFALTGFQATSETAGERFLARIGGSLIEVDRWVPTHREDIDRLSRDRPDAPLVLPDFPIETTVAPQDAIDATDEALKRAVMQSMGETLYREGSGAIRDEEGATHMAFSDPIRVAIDMLGQSAHSFWQFMLAISALILLALCAGMAWSRQSPFSALAVGGLVSAGLSLFAWVGAQMLGSGLDSNVDREIAMVLRDGAWLGVRNGVAAAVIGAGLAFVVASLLPHREPDVWEEGHWRDGRDEEEFEPVQSLPRRPPRF